MRHARFVLVVTALACAGGTARADGSAKRDLPDYDSRGNRDADAGSWALWIPRVALSPVYAVNELALRRPLRWAVSRAENKRWVQSISDLFQFGTDGKNVILPTALVDFGLLPSIGLYVGLEDVGEPDNAMRFHAATGGEHWLSATALDRYRYDDGAGTIAARVEFSRRPDYIFLGTGPDVTRATLARYGLQRSEASASLSRRFTRVSGFTFSAGVRDMSYRAGTCCGAESLETRIANGSLAMPAGYPSAYAVAFQHTELMVDSRSPRPASATGGFLRLHGGSATDITHGNTWISYGAMGGIAFDLTGHQRTLTLTTHVDLVDPVQGIVPFNELAQLGNDQMAGFVLGWMNGRSTFVTEASYRWPVWMWLDGQLRIAAGNAFDEHLSGLELQKLRLSADVGVTSLGSRDAAFEILFGLGSETIEQGAHITSARFSIGTRRGF
jgi:hypothetical protein